MAIRRKKPTTSSPINAKQESLLQQQEQLHLRMRKLEALLAEAPKKAQEIERRQREEGIARATGRSRRLDVPTGVNVRMNSMVMAAPRKLRKERQQAKMQFLVLCVLLLALVYFVLSQLGK